MSKLERQRALPHHSMFAGAPTDSASKALPAAPVNVARKPRKAKEAHSAPVGPFDYAAALKRLGLSHKQAAALLGVSLPSSYKWAARSSPIPAWLPRMMVLVEHVGVHATRTVFKLEEMR